METRNKPYRKELDSEGKVIDIFPYQSGKSTRRIRRGSEKIDIDQLGQVRIIRRVKSSKRKKDWI